MLCALPWACPSYGLLLPGELPVLHFATADHIESLPP